MMIRERERVQVQGKPLDRNYNKVTRTCFLSWVPF